jgi:hypothetical protein
MKEKSNSKSTDTNAMQRLKVALYITGYQFAGSLLVTTFALAGYTSFFQNDKHVKEFVQLLSLQLNGHHGWTVIAVFVLVGGLTLLGLSEFLCTKRVESYPRRARKLPA